MLTVELPASPPLPDHAEQLLDLQLYGQAFLEQRDALAVLMRYLQQPLSVPSSYVSRLPGGVSACLSHSCAIRGTCHAPYHAPYLFVGFIQILFLSAHTRAHTHAHALLPTFLGKHCLYAKNTQHNSSPSICSFSAPRLRTRTHTHTHTRTRIRSERTVKHNQLLELLLTLFKSLLRIPNALPNSRHSYLIDLHDKILLKLHEVCALCVFVNAFRMVQQLHDRLKFSIIF